MATARSSSFYPGPDDDDYMSYGKIFQLRDRTWAGGERFVLELGGARFKTANCKPLTNLEIIGNSIRRSGNFKRNNEVYRWTPCKQRYLTPLYVLQELGTELHYIQCSSCALKDNSKYKRNLIWVYYVIEKWEGCLQCRLICQWAAPFP